MRRFHRTGHFHRRGCANARRDKRFARNRTSAARKVAPSDAFGQFGFAPIRQRLETNGYIRLAAAIVAELEETTCSYTLKDSHGCGRRWDESPPTHSFFARSKSLRYIPLSIAYATCRHRRRDAAIGAVVPGASDIGRHRVGSDRHLGTQSLEQRRILTHATPLRRKAATVSAAVCHSLSTSRGALVRHDIEHQPVGCRHPITTDIR